MIRYKFDRYDNITISEGYASLVISGGEALVDPNSPDQMALAKKHGGVPLPKPTKKSEKEEPKQ